jgi:hypothetical protein
VYGVKFFKVYGFSTRAKLGKNNFNLNFNGVVCQSMVLFG